MSFLARLFRRFPPNEQLAADVVAELTERGVKVKSYDHLEYAVHVEGGRIGLTNLFLEWRLHGRHEKKRIIKRFLDGILAPPITFSTFDSVADRLVPLVRSRHLVTINLLESRLHDAPQSAETAWAPIAGDLAAAIGVDHPDTIGVLTRANLEELNVRFDSALERAKENLGRRLPPIRFVEVGNGLPAGVYASGAATDYESSLLLLPERIPQLPESHGDMIVMVPGRNSVWITGSRNEAGLAALLDVAEKFFEAVPHRCSATLLRRDGGGWAVFRPDRNVDLQHKHDRVMLKQEALNYSQQKYALDKLHQAQDQDVSVGPFNVFTRDGHLVSVSAWPSHADTLLPKTGAISFVDQIVDASSGLAVGTRKIINVAWERAIPLVGPLMEEVPGLYPPRFRVRRFPDDATLAELAKVATLYELRTG
jgi:hypothetical protein